MISQAKLRSAMDGWEFPSKNLPSPLSQKFSIILRDLRTTFLFMTAASRFNLRRSRGAALLFITYAAEEKGFNNDKLEPVMHNVILGYYDCDSPVCRKLE